MKKEKGAWDDPAGLSKLIMAIASLLKVLAPFLTQTQKTFLKSTLKLIPLILLLVPVLALSANVSVTGVTVKAIYTEPAENTDGSPVTDLAKCTVYYDIGTGPNIGIVIPATSPTGGKECSGSFEVPIIAGMERNVRFWATASDLSGNESEKTPDIILRIDRLAPSPPK